MTPTDSSRYQQHTHAADMDGEPGLEDRYEDEPSEHPVLADFLAQRIAEHGGVMPEGGTVDDLDELRARVEPLTVRQVGTLDEALPCGCIPYEHEHYGCPDDMESDSHE